MITLNEKKPEQIINLDVDLIDIQTIVDINTKEDKHLRICFDLRSTVIFYHEKGKEFGVC